MPGRPKAFGTGAHSIVHLQWYAPLDDGGQPVLGYIVQQRSDSAPYIWTTIGSVGDTSFVVAGLVNWQTYYFRVAAENSVGIGAYDETEIRVIGPIPPSLKYPSALNRAIGVGWYSIGGEWDPIGFRIEVRAAGNPVWMYVGTAPASALGFSVTRLTNGTRYYIRVGAMYEDGSFAWAPSVTEVPRTKPSAPRAIALYPGPSEFGITWRPPLSSGGSAVLDYRVEFSLDGITWRTYFSANVDFLADGRYVTFIDAVPTRRYWIRVAARNAVGIGVRSETVTGTAFTYPEPPTVLRGAPGNGSITLRWQRPTTDGGRPISAYQIQVSVWGTGRWTTVGTTTASQFTYTVRGLRNGGHYCVRVASVNSANYGYYAVPIAFYAGSWRAYDPYGQGCYR